MCELHAEESQGVTEYIIFILRFSNINFYSSLNIKFLYIYILQPFNTLIIFFCIAIDNNDLHLSNAPG